MDPTAFTSALKERQRTSRIETLQQKRDEENKLRKQRNLLRDLRSLEMRGAGKGGGENAEEEEVQPHSRGTKTASMDWEYQKLVQRLRVVISIQISTGYERYKNISMV